MRRTEITFGEALLLLILFPFCFVIEIAKTLIGFFVALGFFLVAVTLDVVAFFVDLFRGDK